MFFLIEHRTWFFIQIVCEGDNLKEMSSLILSENYFKTLIFIDDLAYRAKLAGTWKETVITFISRTINGRTCNSFIWDRGGYSMSSEGFDSLKLPYLFNVFGKTRLTASDPGLHCLPLRHQASFRTFIDSKMDLLKRRIRYPASILYKSTAGRYRPVSYPDGPITARYRFM